MRYYPSEYNKYLVLYKRLRNIKSVNKTYSFNNFLLSIILRLNIPVPVNILYKSIKKVLFLFYRIFYDLVKKIKVRRYFI